jgi:hypothetical protein
VRIESPEVHRPEGVGSRKRRGPQGRSSLRRHKPQADSRRAGERGASPGNRNRGPDGTAGESRRQRQVKGMPEGRFTTKAQRREPNAGERQARRLAGRKGRRRRARALGRAPEPEGGRRVERKRRAQAWSGPQPESEARGSGRKSELRATPKGQGKGACRKASSEGRESEPRHDGGQRIDRRREVAGSGLMSWRRRELETRSRQGQRQGASQAGGSAGGQEQAARDGCRSRRAGRKAGSRQGRRRGASPTSGSAAGQADEESWRIGSRRAGRKAGSRQGRRRGASPTSGSAAGHEGQLN